MSEEEELKMDKKSTLRQSSVPPKANGNASKKDNGEAKLQKSGRRGGGGNSGGNNSYSDGQSRRTTPQKYKNNWDKRPRSRADVSDRSRSDLEDVGVEIGSALKAGSKKASLNHLLNFKYTDDDDTQRYRGGGPGGATWGRGRPARYRSSYARGSKVYYNKEQYLQATCQFVVKEGGDYSAQLMDPDSLVSWDAVEQVRVTLSEPPSCPICLEYPTAAKMTRCGHIYCWACILHYLALGEKSWRKCPICYESIHSNDLKSVVAREVRSYKVGDTISMTLMKKDKGSIYTVPAHLWQKQDGNCHNVHDDEEITRHMKVLTASSKQVLEDVIYMEKSQLRGQLMEAEQSEEAFITGAQTQLTARELLFTGATQVQAEVAQMMEGLKPATEDTTETPVPARQYANTTTKVKQYKSAFLDEEDDEVGGGDTEVAGLTTCGPGSSEDGQPSSDDMDISPNQSPEPTSSSPTETSTPDSTPRADCPVGSPEAPQLPVEMVGSPEAPQLPVEMVGSPEAPRLPVEMPDMMPVEEAAEHLELPQGHKSWKMSGEDSFYFYQAADGQHIYMHSVNARCLVREYGSLENSPQTITATIVEKEDIFVTEELRRRLRYLSHLPLTCGFEVAELALRPPLLGKDTLKQFADELEKRHRLRQRRNRDDKRRARRIEEQERKILGIANTGVIIPSQFNCPEPETTTIIPSQFSQSQWAGGQPPTTTSGQTLTAEHDRRSDTSSPSLDTPIGSPPDSAEIKSGTSPTISDDGNQTATLSFAQMLNKAGKRSTTWPSLHKAEEPLSPLSTGSQQDDSDNEDKVPVPRYQSSFGSAIQDAFQNIEHTTRAEVEARPTPGSGKKKKKQLVLFSTSMARGGK